MNLYVAFACIVTAAVIGWWLRGGKERMERVREATSERRQLALELSLLHYFESWQRHNLTVAEQNLRLRALQEEDRLPFSLFAPLANPAAVRREVQERIESRY